MTRILERNKTTIEDAQNVLADAIYFYLRQAELEAEYGSGNSGYKRNRMDARKCLIALGAISDPESELSPMQVWGQATASAVRSVYGE